jgi:hypothetical protein
MTFIAAPLQLRKIKVQALHLLRCFTHTIYKKKRGFVHPYMRIHIYKDVTKGEREKERQRERASQTDSHRQADRQTDRQRFVNSIIYYIFNEIINLINYYGSIS